VQVDGVVVTMGARDRDDGVSKGGRRAYTDEELTRSTGFVLSEPEQRWREDAARYRFTTGAVYIELSRLYMDDEIRHRVLRAIFERSGLPVPDDLT
jgi:hypothetical protein